MKRNISEYYVPFGLFLILSFVAFFFNEVAGLALLSFAIGIAVGQATGENKHRNNQT